MSRMFDAMEPGLFDPIELAAKTVETYLLTGRRLEPPMNAPPDWLKPAGAFVSLKSDGRLRGCIGTYIARQPTLIEEIMHNAISSAVDDPRFLPITIAELSKVKFSIDVLGPLEVVMTHQDLDPSIFGVLIRGSGDRAGLLLPDLKGIDTVDEQVEIAMRKGGLGPDEPVETYRFRVKRYG